MTNDKRKIATGKWTRMKITTNSGEYLITKLAPNKFRVESWIGGEYTNKTYAQKRIALLQIKERILYYIKE